MADGSVHYVDMDINCPTFKTRDIKNFDGSCEEYRQFLLNYLPLMWLDERFKIEDLSSVLYSDAQRCVKVKKINKRMVKATKVILQIYLLL